MDGSEVVILCVVAIIGIGVVTGIAFPYLTQDTVTLTVTDKGIYSDIQCDDHGDCDTYVNHLIYTDLETLENNDNILLWKFGSSELYGKIQKGRAYNFKVYGWRIPILGMYRNVISFSEVKNGI